MPQTKTPRRARGQAKRKLSRSKSPGRAGNSTTTRAGRKRVSPATRRPRSPTRKSPGVVSPRKIKPNKRSPRKQKEQRQRTSNDFKDLFRSEQQKLDKYCVDLRAIERQIHGFLISVAKQDSQSTEGIFRQSAHKDKVENFTKQRKEFERQLEDCIKKHNNDPAHTGVYSDDPMCQSVIFWAALYKNVFREMVLKCPTLLPHFHNGFKTDGMYEDLIANASDRNRLRGLLPAWFDRLTSEEKDVWRHLIGLVKMVSVDDNAKEQTKMDFKNMAIVLGPNIFAGVETPIPVDLQEAITTTAAQNKVIEYAFEFFINDKLGTTLLSTIA